MVGTTLKLVALATEVLPKTPGLSTLIFPLGAAPGTVAVICVSELMANCAAAGSQPPRLRSPKVTPVTVLKCVPVIMTRVPVTPRAGVKLVMVGVALAA